MKVLFRSCLLVFTVFLFAGCGGGSSDGEPSLTPGENAGTDTSTGNPDTTDGSVTEQIVRFGSYSGTTFTAGKIASNNQNLNAGQSATLSVSFIDQNSSPVTDSADIFFASTCIAAGVSEIAPAIATNLNGTVNVTYTARGCSGEDTITAETSLNGTTYSANVTITTVPSPLGSITFVSASPQTINIKGSGGPQGEQSVVTFLVNNESGGPVPNLDVNFYLDTSVGGITISNDTATTNAQGFVTTTVSAGTVATSVRVSVEAVRDGKLISTESSRLVISTGFPDQDSFSISATKLNIDGHFYDGVTTNINIRAAGRFNHPVPDGTAITFWTEGATIAPNCTTVAGKCSVTLETQDPRPADGRITVLAFAIGEESFLDTKPTNGRFDSGETFTDISEPFLDRNENGDYDFGDEEFADFNTDSTWNAADPINGKFDGLLCDETTNAKCSTEANTAYVFESIVIVLSGSKDLTVTLSSNNITLAAQVTVKVTVTDSRGQVPPVGTIVSASPTKGEIVGANSYSMPSSNSAVGAEFPFVIAPSSGPGDGRLDIRVTTPGAVGELGTTYSVSATVTQP
jgi:hypothetical protein